MKNLSKLCLITSLICVSCQISASKQLTTNDFRTVSRQVLQLGKQYGNKHVLLVMDDDNTLTTMPQALGSVSWWDWQEHLLKNQPNSPLLAAKTFTGLMKVQALLFTLSQEVPTQTDLPQIIVNLQRQGIKTLVLTARGPSLRMTTLRQLRQAGFQFEQHDLISNHGFANTYAPYSLQHISRSGINQHKVQQLKLKTPRKIFYHNDILYISGQNKGIMLQTFLHRIHQNYQAIVFVDDQTKNTNAVYQIWKNKTNLTTYRYSRLDRQVKKRSTKQAREKMAKAWVKLRQSIKQTIKQPNL